MYGEKMKLKDDKRRLIIKGKEGKDYPTFVRVANPEQEAPTIQIAEGWWVTFI